MNRALIRWLGAFMVCACGLAGYAAGGGFDEAGKRAALAKIEVLEQKRTASRARRVEMEEFGGFEGLLSGGKETDIWKVVSRMPVARIPEALKKLKEARALTASWNNDSRRLDEIEAALYFHWAESDPAAALADVVTIPKSTDTDTRMRKSRLMTSVLTAWMRTDPNAAYRAVKDDKDLEYYGRDLLVRTWTSANVLENLKLYPENHQLLLGWYCGATADDPSQRNAMLITLRDHPELQNRNWGYQLLFRGWGYKDFNGAVAEAEAQGLPAIVKQLVQDNLGMNPKEVMSWAAKNNVPPGGALWEKGYYEWLGFDGPGARKWLSEQAPLWEGKGYSAAVAGFLAQDFENAGTMKFAAEKEAAATKLTELMIRWKSEDPTAAAKWLDTAPKAARDFLTGKGGAP